MPDDTSARHRIGGNFPPEPLDHDGGRDGRRANPVIQSPIFRIPVAQEFLGDMSKTKIYELMALGELETVKLGSRRFITRASCDEYIVRNTSRSIGDKAAIESAKNAARESVRVRKEKKRLVPGKLRTRAARRAAGASNEGGADT
jgi:hypothetical protein